MELAARKDVPVEETWDLSLIFPDEKLMWEALEKTKADVKRFAAAYAGKLQTAETIVRCLDDREPILIAMERLWEYAGLALEADYTDNALREREAKVSDEMTRLRSEMAFVDSEILLAPDAELKAAVGLAKGCRVYIEDLIAKKAHMLSPETEKVLTALSMSLDVPYTIYNTNTPWGIRCMRTTTSWKRTRPSAARPSAPSTARSKSTRTPPPPRITPA